MRFAASALIALLLFTGCSAERNDVPSQDRASLRDIGLHPENYEIGRRLPITGWLIKPPRSVLFVCDEISSESPPRATGSCSEVENEELLNGGDLMKRGRTRWIQERIDLVCEVTGYRPTDVRPERLALTCNSD